jgi:hypothetical protein
MGSRISSHAVILTGRLVTRHGRVSGNGGLARLTRSALVPSGQAFVRRGTDIDTRDASYDALAAQVSELAQVCAQLGRENAELRDQMAGLRASTPQPASAPPSASAAQSASASQPARRLLDTALSRRTIGKALGAAAAGVVGAAALVELNPRPAAAASASPASAAEESGASEPDAEAVPDTSASPSIVNASITSTSGVIVASNSGTGPGIKATGVSGRGGIFAGSLAQVQLTAGSKSTHPTTGTRGDLYADSTGRLWFCKTTGSKATWHQIA